MQTTVTAEMFAEAYEDGFPLTCRFLTSQGFDRSTATEAAQAAWARGWERREQLRIPGRLLAWINRIAMNFVLSELRTRRRLNQLKENRAVSLWTTNAARCDATTLLRRLSNAERKLLVLQQYYGLTAEEIGRECSISAISVRVRLHRAKKKLRESQSPERRRSAAEPRGRPAARVADKFV